MDYKNIKDVYTGHLYDTQYVTFLLKENNKELYACGDNLYGQLGLNKYSYPSFGKILVSDVKDIITDDFTIILKNDGTVWGIGNNTNGIFGLGHSNPLYQLTQLPIDNVKAIRTEYSIGASIYILKNDGTVWVAGYNRYGQLGLGDTTNRNVFTQVDVEDVKDVQCGWNHMMVLKNDNSLWVCGGNASGQLGLNNKTSTKVLTEVTTNVSDIKQISCAGENSYIVKNDGTLWIAGRNWMGQLGMGLNYKTNWLVFTQNTKVSNVRKIIAFDQASIIITHDNQIYATGSNSYGLFGLGHSNSLFTYTKLNITDVKQINLVSNMMIVLKNDGTVWGTGKNYGGQLGLGHNNNVNILTNLNLSNIEYIFSNTSHSNNINLLNDKNEIVNCGDNYFGQLLRNSNEFSEFTKVDIPNNISIKKFHTYGEASFFLGSDNKLYASGINSSGELGNGDNYETYNRFTPILENVKDFSNGYCNIIAVKNDGTVWASGQNWYQQFGFGPNDYDDRTVFEQIPIDNVDKVYSWYTHIYIVKNDGTLWACGSNDKGQLGLGDTTDRSTFTQVPNMNNIKEIYGSIDYNSNYILKNDGTLWACGLNSSGQLGLGDTTSRSTFTKVTDNVKKVAIDFETGVVILVLKNDGTVWGCGWNGSNALGFGSGLTSLVKLSIENAKDISTTAYSSIIVTNSGELYVSGQNQNGHLGLGHINNTIEFTKVDIDNVDKAWISNLNLIVKLKNGDIYYTGVDFIGCSGCNSKQLNPKGYTTKLTPYLNIISNEKNVVISKEGKYIIDSDSYIPVTDVYYNEDFMISAKKDGLIVKGDNTYGQLGTGDYNNKEEFTEVALPNIKEVTCGDKHTAALNEDGELYVSGSNEHGQLTLNDNKVNEFIKIEDNVSHARAMKGLTIIKKNGKYYVTGKYIGNEFSEYIH